MNASAEVTVWASRMTRRAQQAVILTAAVWLALGLGAVWIIAWKCRGVTGFWRLGAWVAATTVVIGAVAWWVRRHWLSARASLSYLDQALGLQQRLVTAVEFAAAPHPPALYPMLLEDAAARCARAHVTLPQPFNRRTGVAAVALLLLWLLPFGSRPSLMRLAQRPSVPLPPPPQPGQPPPPPQDQQRQPSQGSSSGQPSGGQQDQQHSDAGSGQSSPKPQQGGHSSTQQRDAGSRSDGSSGQTGAGQRREQQDASGQGNEQRSRDARQQGASQAGQPQEAGQPDQAKGSSSTQAGQQQRPGGNQEQAGREGAQGRQAQPSGQQPGERSDASGGQAAGAGSEAMKAEIQQLLKQMSGELKELQAQLESSQPQQAPQAGTSADPNLYESPSLPPQPVGGSEVPMSLETDAKPGSQRHGQGVGRPGDQPAADAPRARAEAAQLADEPRDEPAAARQPVPPEYRSVLERVQSPEEPARR